MIRITNICVEQDEINDEKCEENIQGKIFTYKMWTYNNLMSLVLDD